MLTDAEIAELREKVERAWKRACIKGNPIVGIYRGGPLDGLPAELDEKSFRWKEWSWCCVTRDGPVMVDYYGRGPYRDFKGCRLLYADLTYLPTAWTTRT